MTDPAAPTTASADVALVICAEPGFLEPQTRLLIRSVRRWAGRLANMPIHVYKPRRSAPFSEETLALCETQGVVVHNQVLNEAHADYPMANPIYVGVEAERELDAEFIVLCDCDTVILGPPEEFLLSDGVNVAVQPVRKANRGSQGPDDPYDTFWLEMYRVCGVEPRRYVQTMTDRVTIRGYWNAGLVVARRTSGLMARWLDHFSKLHEATLSQGGSLAALDQLALAPTVDLFADEAIRELSYAYNYVVPQRALMVDPAMRAAPLDDLILLHYHRWFNREGFLRDVQPPFDPSSPKMTWLEEQLPLQPAHHEPIHGLEPDHLSDAERRQLHRTHSSAFKRARQAYFSNVG